MSSRSFLPLLALFLALGCVFVSGVADVSTQWEVIWGNTGNEEGFYHVLDGSGTGSIFVAGYTESTVIGTPGGTFTANNAGYYDAYILKYNNRGIVQWMRVLQSAQYDIINTITSDVAGNVYVCGATTGYMGTIVPRQNGYWDSWCAKYDTNGLLLWLTSDFSRSRTDFVVKAEAKGSFLYVTGGYDPTNGYYHVYVKKLRQSDGVAVNGWGLDWVGGGHDIPDSMLVDANNYVYIVGHTTSSFPTTLDSEGNTQPGFTNAGQDDGFLLVLDGATGNKLLNLNIGGTGIENAFGIAVDGVGGIYITGGTTGPLNGQVFVGSGSNTWLVKYQADASMTSMARVWTRQLGSQSSGRSVLYDGVGGIYVIDVYGTCAARSYYSDFYLGMNSPGYCSSSQQTRNLRKWDTNGNLVWSYQFDGGVNSMSLDNNGGLIASGLFRTSYNAAVAKGGADAFLRTQQINYNCSCSDLETLVNEVQQLLNIAPVF